MKKNFSFATLSRVSLTYNIQTHMAGAFVQDFEYVMRVEFNSEKLVWKHY